MLRHLLFISFFAAVPGAFAQTSVPGGNVSGTWTPSGSPYLVQGSIMIPADSVLVILPGVTVNFQGHYKLLVLGRLLAVGTATDQILFTTDNMAAGWYGIRFNGTNPVADSSIFAYCTIRYGRATDPEPWGGGIEIADFSKVRVSNCLFSHNYANGWGGGIDIDNCSPVILNNKFEFNSVDSRPATLNGGGALSCSSCSSLISGNIFTNNTSASQVGGGGALFLDGGSPVVLNNTISYNTNTNNSFYGDGGGGGIFSSGNAAFTNNTISNNTVNGYISRGGGIFFYYQDHSTLVNNTITNNSAGDATGCGGGIYCYLQSNPVFTNNTIANNSATQDGGAVYCNSSCDPLFRNCIIWGNTNGIDSCQVYLYDDGSDPDFYFCDVQRGSAGFNLNGNFYTGHYGEDCFNRNPRFYFPSAGSGTSYNGVNACWWEGGASPCINYGDPAGTYPPTDKAGYPRIFDGRIDLGAYEFQFHVGTGDHAPGQQTRIVPNPFTSSAVIRLDNEVSCAMLRITDISGNVVRILSGISGDRVTIDRGNLAPGVYRYELFSGNDRVGTGNFIIVVQ